MLRPLAIASILLAVVLTAGCGSGATKDDFQRDAVAARDKTDSGLAQIVLASSVEDLLARMRIAAVEVRSASTEVREADAPNDLEDERDALAASLLALSDEIVGTVETLQSFPEQAAKTSALNFEQWTAVQKQLANLRKQGVNVPALEPHKPEPQRQ